MRAEKILHDSKKKKKKCENSMVIRHSVKELLSKNSVTVSIIFVEIMNFSIQNFQMTPRKIGNGNNRK